MAIGKDIVTAYSVTAQYHRIVKIVRHFDDTTIRVHLASYSTRQARNNEAQPLATEVYVLPAGQGDPSRADLYTALKALPTFADAVDV